METKSKIKHPVVGLWYETAKLARKERKLPVVALVERGRQRVFFVLPADPETLRRVADCMVMQPARPKKSQEEE